jgi:hypothetical protein
MSTLIQAYERITNTITQLKNGDITPTTARRVLQAITTQVNSSIPGVAIQVPTQPEIAALYKANIKKAEVAANSFVSSDPDFESSYESSQC